MESIKPMNKITTGAGNVSSLDTEISLVIAVVAFMSIPALSMAANYGFVNNLGNVSMVSANDALTAIAIAPNISTHSGVILLTTQMSSDLLNDRVMGL